MVTHSKPDALMAVEELNRLEAKLPKNNGFELYPSVNWSDVEARMIIAAARKGMEAEKIARENFRSDSADHYNALRDILLLWHDDETVGNITTSETLEKQKCRHDKAGSSSQGDYWYCDERGVEGARL